MSVKMKTRIEDIPNIWYMDKVQGSNIIIGAGYDLSEKRLFLRYNPNDDVDPDEDVWFLYENVPSKWWRDFTLAEDKDAFVKETRKKVLVSKHRVHLHLY